MLLRKTKDAMVRKEEERKARSQEVLTPSLRSETRCLSSRIHGIDSLDSLDSSICLIKPGYSNLLINCKNDFYF